MSDLALWLQSLGLEKYEEALRAHDVDLEIASELTEQDLERLGFSLGHRRKFLAAAARLRGHEVPRAEALADAVEVERRQVTVVFTDLVDSTALARKLDPEDLNRLLERYRAACTSVIARYDGHVAQYLGDGILAYFGYPKAQEHAAERAVRAGLEVAAEVGRLERPGGAALKARVGIATGLVVAGAHGSDGEQTVVGDTPNLAARLQSVAEAGSVLVSASTHQLTADFFEYLFAGAQEVKGFREPIAVWRALGASAVESRFIAARAAIAAPIIGRDRELAYLDDAWRRAVDGNGHLVLVSGEAGMGKSRLLEALAERVRDQPHRLLRAQCSPYHANIALHPFIQLLRHRLDLRRDARDAENLERIDRMLAHIDQAGAQARALLAELLGLRPPPGVAFPEMTPTQRKNATLALVEAFLVAPLDGSTVLLLVEDLHWSDPTTQALIERLLARIERERLLVVATHRPEAKPGWAEHRHASTLRCKQLGPEQCGALARHVAGPRRVDASVIGEITRRSDGVPLFVEELTKAVLDLHAPATDAVPLTLKDSLTARLDRLGGAKEVAQAAAVIGRQFPLALLAAVAEAHEDTLRGGLARLQESGLVFAAGDGEETAYVFNHALVQEAAYESLSRARRQVLHGRTARAIGAAGAGEPAVLAHHYGRAGEAQEAFECWMRAADQSSARHAFGESIAALEYALAEAARVPDAALGARMKLDAQLKLGTALVFQKGPQAPEAEAALTEAYRLAKEVNAGPQMFQSTWGLYLNAARNRRLDKAKIRGEELLAISDALGDEDLKLEALHHRWGLAYFMGYARQLVDYAEQGIRRYDAARHHRFSYTFAGHDPGVCAYCCRAMGFGISGDAARIKPDLAAALALSERLRHPLTHVFAESIICHALYFTRDAEACAAAAEALVRDATRFDLPANRAVGEFWVGAAQGMRGDSAGGLERMEPTFEPTHGFGFFAALPGVVMTETLIRAGREGDALALIARLLGEMNDPQVGVFASELWRIRGELVARGGDAAGAEHNLRTALRIATAQQAALLQAKAAIALARYLGECGRRGEAQAALEGSGIDALPDRTAPEVEDAARLASALA